MRAISLWQPWASAVARGFKQVETRGRATSYRGPLAIHAAKRWTPLQRETAQRLALEAGEDAAYFDTDPRGAVVCVVTLTGCVEMTPALIARQTDLERAFGDWKPGRYAWLFENVRGIFMDPVPLRGHQWIWTPTEDERRAIEEACR